MIFQLHINRHELRHLRVIQYESNKIVNTYTFNFLHDTYCNVNSELLDQSLCNEV